MRAQTRRWIDSQREEMEFKVDEDAIGATLDDAAMRGRREKDRVEEATTVTRRAADEDEQPTRELISALRSNDPVREEVQAMTRDAVGTGGVEEVEEYVEGYSGGGVG